MTKIKDLIKYKHPNSRKTNALAKQIKKAKSREKIKQNSNVKLNLIGEKLMWFKENLEPNCSMYTPQQTLEIIEKYLERFSEELEQIKIKHSIGNRKNRQHASREDIIKLTIKTETDEFDSCGLEVPDLLNPIQFDLLKQWNGELRYLPKFSLKRFSKSFLQNSVNKTNVINKQEKKSKANFHNDVTMESN